MTFGRRSLPAMRPITRPELNEHAIRRRRMNEHLFRAFADKANSARLEFTDGTGEIVHSHGCDVNPLSA